MDFAFDFAAHPLLLPVPLLRSDRFYAGGVDEVSFQEYERELEANLTDLESRLKRKAYRARFVRRKYIPKGNGKPR
jgi:hypothetical protein